MDMADSLPCVFDGNRTLRRNRAMSTSILYHAFGLKGIEYKATHFVADRIIFSAEMNDQWVRCPQCGCRKTIFKGQKRRWFYMSPIGRKKCMLELILHRLKC